MSFERLDYSVKHFAEKTSRLQPCGMDNSRIVFTRLNASQLHPYGMDNSRVVFTRLNASRLSPAGANNLRVALTRKSASRLHPCGMDNSRVIFTRLNASQLSPAGANNLRVALTRKSASRLHPCGMDNSRVIFTRKNGFTLIEILVALAIIAIALAALMKSSGNHTYSAAYLKQKTLAHYVAVNEMELLRIAEDWPDVGTERGSTEMADREWYWTREIEKTVIPYVNKSSDIFIAVTFTVYLDEDRKQNLAKYNRSMTRIDAKNAASIVSSLGLSQ